MLVSLSGTPGTGKSTAAALLDPEVYETIHMNKLSENHIQGFDGARGSAEVDMEALLKVIGEGKLKIPENGKRHVIIVGHLSHHLPVDLIIVLRISTKPLEQRLRLRRYSQEKIRENMEAEALSVITIEALNSGSPVYEIDTTQLTPPEVASHIRQIISSPSEPLTGPEDIINFTGEIMEWY